MIRHCDGQDPNLVRKVGEPDVLVYGQSRTSYNAPMYEPCDCGLTFDDVDHSVVYPHESVGVDFNKIRAAIKAMPDGELKDMLTRHFVDVEELRSDVAERTQ